MDHSARTHGSKDGLLSIHSETESEKLRFNHTPPRSPPPKGSSNRGSLLQRFLANTSRRRSQTHLSGEGSTVSRLTDDEPELDASSPLPRFRPASLDKSDTPSRRQSKSSTASPGASPGLIQGLVRRFSGDGPRRHTMDLGKSSQHSRRSKDSVSLDNEFPLSSFMGEDDYATMQAALQKRAEDLHKSGQLEQSISQWVECLALAEDNTDTLANKTEMLCILLDLHIQVAQQLKAGETEQAHEAEEVSEGIQHHLKAARQYAHRIKPAVVKASWWVCSRPLLDLLVDAEAWELAVIVADSLQQQSGIDGPKSEELATIHFQIASLKLDNHRQGEALQHLQATVKHLQQVKPHERDMDMYLQVLQLLAAEYKSQEQYSLALETYEEQLKCAPSEKQASLYCQMAEVYITNQQLDLALDQLESAASTLHLSEQSIRLELLQTKGDVFCRLGRSKEALQVYQSALEEAVNPAEKAKLLYTLGRLCVRLKHIRLAISYFTREMEITETELGEHHLSVSRVLHELAKLYDEGLGEHKMALLKLHKALHIELAVLQECHAAIVKCPRCNQVTHRMCITHANLQKDISNQIRETKKAQGRIHFKLGDFDKALKTSFDGTEHNDGIGSKSRR